MPGGTRTGRGLAYCTVHWRIRPRSARPDNRRKRVTNSESRAHPGRARLADRTAEGGAMEPPATGYDAIDHTQSSVHDWRVSQLTRLGIPGPLAEVYADRIDWHQIARLVCRGCPPRLALHIVC